MSSLDLDLDGRIEALELEWRLAYEAGQLARAEIESTSPNTLEDRRILSLAGERLERLEVQKARIMAKIERLEDSMLRRG
ncbi:MAG: hypothetical protein QOF42_1802 [Gammaproteobacteria bacterium]|jgi:hypothetical protein|nr:hypothetical protein [Gammaproteobacteria bacterium]